MSGKHCPTRPSHLQTKFLNQPASNTKGWGDHAPAFVLLPQTESSEKATDFPLYNEFMLGISTQAVVACSLLLSLLWPDRAWAAQTAPSPRGGSDTLAQVRALLNQNEPEAAEKLLRPYLTSHPNAAQAHFLLGYILFREIQTEEAATSGSAALPPLPSSVALREKNARESLAQYTLGSQLQTPSAFDLKIVSLDYILLNDYPDADKWLSKALIWQPNDAQGWYYKGRIKFKQANYSAAIEAFRHALTLRPQNIAAADNLGLAYAGLGQTDAAREAFQTAIAWTKAQHSTNNAPWVDMGDTLTQDSRAAEAVSYLQQAVSMDPKDLRAHEKLAEAFRNLEQWPQEQLELEKAVQLAPHSASLHFMLGQVYRKNGEPDKARTEFAASAALHTHDATGAADPLPH